MRIWITSSHRSANSSRHEACPVQPPERGTDLIPLKRRGVTDGAVLAIVGVVCFMCGVIALAFGLSLDSVASDFKSAAPCRPIIQNVGCLEQREIEITAVGTGRLDEVSTVDFLDSGNPYESHLGPGRQDRSVLKPGASGTATLWHGKYTNLDVAGIDFVTEENPIAQQGQWALFAFIGIGFAVILWTASWVWGVMNRRNLMPTPTDPPSVTMLP